MRRIIASAEPFGFGPVSKLRSIGAALDPARWEVDFVGTGTALTYADGEPTLFRQILPLERPTDLAAVRPDGYDLALSVMDPFLAVWAAHNGVPCVYVDSLFWMWDWHDADEVAARWKAITTGAASLAASLEQVAISSMPAAEYVGHRLATVSCVQRTPSISRAAAVRGDVGPIVETGGIVDLSRRAGASHDTWLVCLSGLRNPLIDGRDAVRWARAGIQLVEAALADCGVAIDRVHLTGNAEVLGIVADLPGNVEFVPRSATDVLDLMNSALACLTPPGLTTMLESLAYGCPVVPLPPQHYAHDRILAEFSDRTPGAFRQSISAEALVPVPSGDVAADTRELIGAFSEMATGAGALWRRTVAALASELRRVADSRADVLGVQSRIAEGFLGGFNGAGEVVDVIETQVRGPVDSRGPAPDPAALRNDGLVANRAERGEQNLGGGRP